MQVAPSLDLMISLPSLSIPGYAFRRLSRRSPCAVTGSNIGGFTDSAHPAHSRKGLIPVRVSKDLLKEGCSAIAHRTQQQSREFANIRIAPQLHVHINTGTRHDVPDSILFPPHLIACSFSTGDEDIIRPLMAVLPHTAFFRRSNATTHQHDKRSCIRMSGRRIRLRYRFAGGDPFLPSLPLPPVCVSAITAVLWRAVRRPLHGRVLVDATGSSSISFPMTLVFSPGLLAHSKDIDTEGAISLRQHCLDPNPSRSSDSILHHDA
jgi:hypothetical protein